MGHSYDRYRELAERLRRSETQQLAVVCYIEYADKLLMIERRREPFAGFLTPPGGRVEDGETILQALEREVGEETGLELSSYQLKVISSEIGPEHYNWLLFIFRGTAASGDAVPSEEGRLIWVSKKWLAKAPISPIDKFLAPFIMEPKSRKYIAFVNYAHDGKIEEIEVRTLETWQLLDDERFT